MALNKRLMGVGAAAADANLPSEYFNTVLYTGNGGTQRVGGYINRGGVFNGSSSYINFGDSPDLRLTGSYSVSGWVNFNSITASNQRLINKDNANDYSGGYSLNVNSTNIFWQHNNGSATDVSYAHSFSTGTWYHFTITYDSSTTTNNLKLYINGSNVSTSDAASPINGESSNYLFFGTYGSTSPSGQYLNGKLDQVRFFDKALSSGEVTTLYGETHTSTTISTTDIFSDGSGVALYQLDGNANDTGGVSGKFGAAAIFNGSSSYISIGNPVPNTDTEVSMSAWINLSSGVSTHMHITGSGITTSLSEAPFRITLQYQSANTFRLFALRQVAGTYYLSPNASLTDVTINANTWYHVAYSYNPTGRKLTTYLNGSVVDTDVAMTTTGASVNDDSMIIGSFRTNSTFFNGKIDDLRIYLDTLTSDEVGYLYNNTTASIPTDNLEAYYKLDGNALDSANSFDGTESNITYGFDGTASNVVYQEATNFTPDFIWVKNRDTTSDQVVFDSVRGVQERIFPNEGYQESNSSTSLTSFDSNGFTVGSDANINGNNNDIVAWCFNAGTGAAASNTDGTTASTVKSNTDAGFSIVKYTAGGTANVGHGLSSAPELIITKNLDISEQWFVYAESVGTQKFLGLNTTSTPTSNSGVYTSITDSTFTNNISATSRTYVNYCFHSVDGIQKVGSYTGTGGSVNVETGFEPAWIMIKRTDSAEDWKIIDNKRDNFADALEPNEAIAEENNNNSNFIPTSNGFQMNDTSGDYNANGGTYIYLAIAADPDTTTPVVENSFDVVTWTGNSSTQSIEVAFKPDFVWSHWRSGSTSRSSVLFDSIRGATNYLHTQATSASNSISNSLTSFNDDGFTMGSWVGANESGNNWVSWCWKAGDHDDNLPQINTEGDIDSIVSVNDASGFSIVKWTGDGVSSSTVGHGLSSAPEMIIAKSISEVNDWNVNHVGIPNKIIYLHSNNAAFSGGGTNGAFGYQSTNTATTFQFTAGSSGVNNVNKSGQQYIAYCFTSITNYQKLGSYSGTGVDGNRIYTTDDGTSSGSGGFEPRWLLVKRTDAADNWVIVDTARGLDGSLFPDLNSQELSNSNVVSFNSDGFTVNGASGGWNNGSGTYIYLAIK